MAIAVAEDHRYGYHNSGADEADAEGYFAFYTPALPRVQRLNNEEAPMDISDPLPPGQYVIYALIDPTDEIVHYVGQTRNPTRRLEQHLGARHHQGAKGDWLRHLRQKGQQPLMQILEDKPRQDLMEVYFPLFLHQNWSARSDGNAL